MDKQLLQQLQACVATIQNSMGDEVETIDTQQAIKLVIQILTEMSDE